jgi:hypothetical protein
LPVSSMAIPKAVAGPPHLKLEDKRNRELKQRR